MSKWTVQYIIRAFKAHHLSLQELSNALAAFNPNVWFNQN